ncbi:MAG: transaldolase family protein [Sphaerochaetaceae bacterium]|jgi:transaldolase
MSYLKQVHAKTDTRFWVNNPSFEECDLAIAEGAFGVTTNPAFCAKLFQSAPEYMHSVVQSVVKTEKDIDKAAEKIYHQVCKDLMDRYLPVYEKSGKTSGFVTVQEDPRREEDHNYIIEASLRAKELAPNYMAKIPITEFGLKVVAELVKHDVPICGTEIFSLSQVTALNNVYEESAKASSKRPPLYITHITGIMDQYFADLVKKESIQISKEALDLAGTIIAQKVYRLIKDENMSGTFLGGGARGLQHFTNFVGGDLHVTINWSTAVELNETQKEVQNGIDTAYPSSIVDELLEKLPNFKRAYEPGAMSVESFADYGPVMLFRTMFMNGYSRLVDSVYLAQ